MRSARDPIVAFGVAVALLLGSGCKDTPRPAVITADSGPTDIPDLTRDLPADLPRDASLSDTPAFDALGDASDLGADLPSVLDAVDAGMEDRPLDVGDTPDTSLGDGARPDIVSVDVILVDVASGCPSGEQRCGGTCVNTSLNGLATKINR